MCQIVCSEVQRDCLAWCVWHACAACCCNMLPLYGQGVQHFHLHVTQAKWLWLAARLQSKCLTKMHGSTGRFGMQRLYRLAALMSVRGLALTHYVRAFSGLIPLTCRLRLRTRTLMCTR